MKPVSHEHSNTTDKPQSKYQTISNGVNPKQKNKQSKSLLLSWQGALSLLILLWAALLLKGILASNNNEIFASLWLQFFYIIWHIFALILLVFLCWGLGRKISKGLKISYSALSEEFPFATSLGLGALSLIILILGAIKLFHPTAVYIITLVVLILVIGELKEITCHIRKSWEKTKDIKLDVISTITLCLIGLTALILLTGAFTPPISYDGLAYHLGVPKTYINEYGIVSLPYHVYSNFPFNMEMLYAYSILLTGNEILAKMLHFLAAILICFALYSFGKKYFDQKIGILSAAIFINIPLVGQLSATCYNDLGLALFMVLSVFAFINWLSSPGKEKSGWLLLCGILTGLALGTKYFAITFLFIFLIPAIGIASILSPDSKRRTFCLTKNLILFAGSAFCVFLPWMLKNLIITGNPVFPFVYPILGGGNWTTAHYQRFLNVHLPNIFTFKEFFLQLWKLLSNHMFGSSFAFVLPLLFILKKIDSKIKILLIYASYYYLIWFFFTHRVDRFIMPIYVFLSLIVAYTLFHLPKILRTFAGSLLTIFIAFNLFTLMVIAENSDFAKAFTSIKSKETYLEENLYYYPAIKYINEKLPHSSKILFVGDNQTYYCEKPLLSNSPLDKSIIVETVRNSKNSEDVKNKLKTMGITHIYYNSSEVKRIQDTYHSFDWRDKEEYTFIDFIENYTQKIFEKNGCIIFEIK